MRPAVLFAAIALAGCHRMLPFGSPSAGSDTARSGERDRSHQGELDWRGQERSLPCSVDNCRFAAACPIIVTPTGWSLAAGQWVTSGTPNLFRVRLACPSTSFTLSFRLEVNHPTATASCWLDVQWGALGPLGPIETARFGAQKDGGHYIAAYTTTAELFNVLGDPPDLALATVTRTDSGLTVGYGATAKSAVMSKLPYTVFELVVVSTCTAAIDDLTCCL